MSDYMYGPVAGLPGSLVQGTAPWFLQDGCLSESWPRWACRTSIGLTSGTLYLVAVPLFEGQVVSTISFLAGNQGFTPGDTGPAWYFALYDVSLQLVAQTVNQVNATWNANVLTTLPLQANYRVPVSGVYYAGIMIYEGVDGSPQMPSVIGNQVYSEALSGLSPSLMGPSTVGLNSGVAPAIADEIVADDFGLWCQIN